MSVGRAIIVISILGGIAGAQNELPREVLAFSRIRQKMRQNLSRLPDYTCVETIDRMQRSSDAAMFRPVDTVRVDVLHVGDKELYAWRGSKKFEDSLSHLVAAGTTSSGEFALHARSIFVGDAQSKYAGEESIRGRRTMRFDYFIPLLTSGLTLSDGQRTGHVSVRGSFWADAVTLDLLRLDVHAEDIPPSLPFTAAVSTVDYGRVRIGGSDTLLPQSATVLLTKTAGSADRNHLQFSQCRAYGAQSEIRYEAAADNPAPEVEKFREFDLPADVVLSLRLEHAIDSTSALEGDLITAKIEQDVKRKNTVLVPAGAIAQGRIRRLESYDQPRPHFIVGLEFLEIESAGQRAAFTGRLDRIDPLPGITWYLSNSKARSFTDAAGGSHEDIQQENVRTAELPGVGTFFVEGSRFHLPEGLHMVWRTVELKK
jgi:hypothetical protein